MFRQNEIEPNESLHLRPKLGYAVVNGHKFGAG
jgi:hypothetical protein